MKIITAIRGRLIFGIPPRFFYRIMPFMTNVALLSMLTFQLMGCEQTISKPDSLEGEAIFVTDGSADGQKVKQDAKLSIGRVDNEEDTHDNIFSENGVIEPNITLPISCQNSDITQAFINKQSHIQVKGCGTIAYEIADIYTPILEDGTVPHNVDYLTDNEDQHYQNQRFIVYLSDVYLPQQIMLVRHESEKPLINALKTGDAIKFYGSYVYTPKGGSVYWKDGSVVTEKIVGWVEKDGVRYE